MAGRKAWSAAPPLMIGHEDEDRREYATLPDVSSLESGDSVAGEKREAESREKEVTRPDAELLVERDDGVQQSGDWRGVAGADQQGKRGDAEPERHTPVRPEQRRTHERESERRQADIGRCLAPLVQDRREEDRQHLRRRSSHDRRTG